MINEAKLLEIARAARLMACLDYREGVERGGMNAAEESGYKMYSNEAKIYCTIYLSEIENIEREMELATYDPY